MEVIFFPLSPWERTRVPSPGPNREVPVLLFGTEDLTPKSSFVKHCFSFTCKELTKYWVHKVKLESKPKPGGINNVDVLISKDI